MSTKAAVVTGAGKRIGRVVALSLAGDGWRVILHYNRSRAEAEAVLREIEACGGSGAVVGADLATAEEAAGLIDRAFALAPGLELIVSNASTFTHDDAATADAEAMQAAFAVNAVAPVLMAQRFAQRLPQGRQGCIVMMLDNRIEAPNPDYFSYGISKFAALGATRMLALALAPRVRVNGIAPGITLPSGAQSDAEFAAAHRINPLQRGCTPEEIAAAVRLIAASSAMTGSIITIDGGQALANPGRDVAFIVPEGP